MAWLSIVYAKLVYRELKFSEDRKRASEMLDRAKGYLEHLQTLVLPDGRIPDYFQDGEPSLVAPYAVAHGLYVSAAISIRQSEAELNRS